jgi:hypothetical protein
MKNFEVEHGVPMPSAGVRPAIYPFAKMEIGDSFFIPKKTSADISSSGVYWAKKLGHKYSARSVIENGIPGTRIWRVKKK